MISYETACLRVIEHAEPLSPESAPLSDSLGQFLASSVIADCDLPRFTSSAVDGFGVRVSDVANAARESPAVLHITGVVHAGDEASLSLTDGSAIKLMTGARIPDGVEAVVMRECTEESSSILRVYHPANLGENIRPKGAEARAGSEILAAGTRVTPPVIALLSALGKTDADVHGAPKVTIVSTGSELVDAGASLSQTQVYDANLPGLRAALTALHITDISTVRVTDDAERLTDAIGTAIAESDLVITAGGVSAGDRDFVRPTLEKLGVREVYYGVAMRPGKPNYFGVHQTASGRKTLVFGLPGNPVSALVSFDRFVKPAILKMLGARDIAPRATKARIDRVVRNTSNRLEFIRGYATVADDSDCSYAVTPLDARESHMISGLAKANCLIRVPAQSTQIEGGALVDVEFLDW